MGGRRTVHRKGGANGPADTLVHAPDAAAPPLRVPAVREAVQREGGNAGSRRREPWREEVRGRAGKRPPAVSAASAPGRRGGHVAGGPRGTSARSGALRRSAARGGGRSRDILPGRGAVPRCDREDVPGHPGGSAVHQGAISDRRPGRRPAGGVLHPARHGRGPGREPLHGRDESGARARKFTGTGLAPVGPM